MSKRKRPPSQRQEPKDLGECLRLVAQMQVAFARQMTSDDDCKIRSDIKAAFAEAIGGDKEYRIKFQTSNGETETGITMAGAFRTVFKIHRLDRKDQWQQERWWVVVSAAMEQAVARNDGDFRRRSA